MAQNKSMDESLKLLKEKSQSGKALLGKEEVLRGLRKGLVKKVFLSSPLHHHLEAKGWSESKIVMRFWMISMIASMIGLILILMDRTL